MLIQRGDGRAVFCFLVAIETDPQRYRGQPGVLPQGDADQMLAHLAADLRTLLTLARKCELAAAGALYDQCQALRPGMPLFEALAVILDDSRNRGQEPAMIALGADQGGMPAVALEPDPSLPPAVLQLLPLVAAGPSEVIEELADEMEHRFLAEGQVSAHTASWLETAFGIAIAHARFMTITDLNAMFRIQMEHFGFLPLWELIDAAVWPRDEDLDLQSENGTRYRCSDGSVRVTFQTFDHWASEGAGRALPADAKSLAGGYADWTRQLRRYIRTLAAHCVPLVFELPEGSRGQVDGRWLFDEVAAPQAGRSLASITEHGHPELGIVAVTALCKEHARHYYPLAPRGLNEIHEEIQALELGGEGMAFPGCIEVDPAGRCLAPSAFDAYLGSE